MSNAKFDMKDIVLPKPKSKKEVNDHLKRVKDIRNGKVDGRYDGLYMRECETPWEKLYWNTITGDIGYKPEKEIFNAIYIELGLPVGESKEFEKNMGGVIIRNLPANVKYRLTGSGSFAEGDGWCCENCGRWIRHWNAVRPDGGDREYLIGSECIKTVVKYDGTEEWHIQQILSEASKWQRFASNMRKLLREGGRMEEEGSSIFFYEKDRRGWKGRCSKEQWELVNRKGVKQNDEQKSNTQRDISIPEKDEEDFI